MGWTAAIEDDGALQLRHPLQDMVLSADTFEQMRRMLSAWFPPDSAIMEALRQAPDHAEDLALSSDPRLPSAVLGVMADRGFIEDETYEWFHRHAEVVVGWEPR